MPNWVSALVFVPVVIFGGIGSFFYIWDRIDAHKAVKQWDRIVEYHDREWNRLMEEE